MEKSILRPTPPDTRCPFEGHWDGVIDIKKEKKKIQIWKNMCNIKVYGRTILFCVHVSLLSEMDTWTPKEDVKIGLFSICTKTKKTSEKIFYVPIDFTLGGDGKVQLDNPSPPLQYAPTLTFTTFQKFIFPWIHFLLFIFIKFLKGEKMRNDRWNVFQGSRREGCCRWNLLNKNWREQSLDIKFRLIFLTILNF